ncbi:hypothetical protein LCGC14_2037790 [marine sediment metagenome]|uniref:Uncharacterized protein n=1 Tax=marine sediment metagenome TaxID=412755 RepID=A0A0F9ESZ6_9ZZZZ
MAKFVDVGDYFINLDNIAYVEVKPGPAEGGAGPLDVYFNAIASTSDGAAVDLSICLKDDASIGMLKQAMNETM